MQSRTMHEDEITDEDIAALTDLEMRALRRAAEDEIQRRSAAMSVSMRFWRSG